VSYLLGQLLLEAVSDVRLQRDPWRVRIEAVALLHRAAAVLELDPPTGARVAFIEAGNELDALFGVARICASAKKAVCFIDRYMDELVLTKPRSVSARETGARIITRDRAILAYGAAGHVRTIAC